MTIKLVVQFKGSAKSGNYGHAGRPGKLGGSAPKGGAPPGGRPNASGGYTIDYAHRYADSEAKRQASLQKTLATKKANAVDRFGVGNQVQVPVYNDAGRKTGMVTGTIQGVTQLRIGTHGGHIIEARDVKLPDGTTDKFSLGQLKAANKPAAKPNNSGVKLTAAEKKRYATDTMKGTNWGSR